MIGERTQATLVALAVMCGLAIPAGCAGQGVGATERDALIRLGVDRGQRAEDIDTLVQVASEAGTRGLPVTPITSKIREGLAKGATTARIDAVIRQLAGHLESADQMIRELQPYPSVAEREPAVTLLAEALGSGVNREEVAEIRRQAQPSGRPALSTDTLAGAAKGFSFIKEAKLPSTDGTVVIAEAVRQGFRPHEMIDLGREVKRRERDYREGRASLLSLRDAIARGSRPDQLFRDSRAGSVERPAATRPEPTATRPEPVTRPERPQPERPTRPERPTTGRTR